MRRTTHPVLVSVLLALAAAGCGASTVVPSTEAPQPAGASPSSIAKLVCQKKAITEIDEAIGENATVSDPTWVDHLYSCDYKYAKGIIVLSVKELSGWSQTLGYFRSLAESLKKKMPIYDLGQGAFRGRDGSIAVRKDWKVLLVNVKGIPSEFGAPPTSSDEVALAVASVILACWKGD